MFCTLSAIVFTLCYEKFTMHTNLKLNNLGSCQICMRGQNFTKIKLYDGSLLHEQTILHGDIFVRVKEKSFIFYLFFYSRAQSSSCNFVPLCKFGFVQFCALVQL